MCERRMSVLVNDGEKALETGKQDEFKAERRDRNKSCVRM